jgi:hypothetical protein
VAAQSSLNWSEVWQQQGQMVGQQITQHPAANQEGPAVAAQGDMEAAAIGKLPGGAAMG